MKTVIVVPTYNEKENMGLLMKEIFSIVPDISVLIVDDSSPDGTGEEVKKLQTVYPRLFLLTRAVKDGLGNAYKAGFKKVIQDWPDTEVVMMMDADFTHEPSKIPALLAGLSDVDMVIGSCHKDPAGMKDYPWHRALLGKWSNIYCRTILGYPLTDWTNAFVAIRMSHLKNIDFANLDGNEFAFIFEFRYALLKNGARWKEIFTPAMPRRAGESKMQFSTIWESVRLPWKLRFKK
ncbi:MAG: Glycosyltransferases involved in cell wall bioproteini [Parcubacteria group bacterium Gr01-1014_70]|nr:MAG: Glycosyltransferases involved in cell wall bioproteini [Parcubacteria group bacterium Gr01-1014_70]